MNDSDVLAVAERLFTAIETGDVDAVAALYAPNAVIWHNDDGVEQDVETNLKVLGWLIRHLHERRYDVVRREALADGFLQQHVLRGRTDTGADFAMAACIVARVENGRIARVDEYLDPAAAAPLRARA
jgi:ketosteroid isomerase-like protein